MEVARTRATPTYLGLLLQRLACNRMRMLYYATKDHIEICPWQSCSNIYCTFYSFTLYIRVNAYNQCIFF
jgi:hypothetical protein